MLITPNAIDIANKDEKVLGDLLENHETDKLFPFKEKMVGGRELNQFGRFPYFIFSVGLTEQCGYMMEEYGYLQRSAVI